MDWWPYLWGNSTLGIDRHRSQSPGRWETWPQRISDLSAWAVYRRCFPPKISGVVWMGIIRMIDGTICNICIYCDIISIRPSPLASPAQSVIIIIITMIHSHFWWGLRSPDLHWHTGSSWVTGTPTTGTAKHLVEFLAGPSRLGSKADGVKDYTQKFQEG